MPAGQGLRPVALVTGGAKRVGRAIAMRLAEGGFDIALTFMTSRQQAAETAAAIEAMGRRAAAIQADLTQPAQATNAIAEEFRQTYSRLDVLVNNASLYEPDTLASAQPALARRMWAIHVESPLLLCQTFAPMLRASRGHVVNMVDLLAEKPWPQYLTYCASKAGLLNLTLGLAKELAPEVTVNGIAPGVVEWPEDMPQEERERYLKRVPLARAGTPQDVADTVHFLCTSGSYITGQIIRLDGGRSIT